MRSTARTPLRFVAVIGAAGLAGCSSGPSHPPDLGDCTASVGPCATPVTGGGSGSLADAGPSGNGCAVNASDSQCDQCANASCCTSLSACFTNVDCFNLLSCEDSCNSAACFSACGTQFPAGLTALASLASCEAAECKVCSEFGVGDPCSAQDSTCSPGLLCPGSWCTKACNASTDCVGLGAGGGNGINEPNACIQTAASGRICYPGCGSDTDCAAFPGTYCLETMSVSAESVLVCVPLPDAGSE